MEKGEPGARKKQRWIIVAYFFFSGILTATWSSRIPDVQHRLGLSNAALGTVLFAIPVGLVAGLAVASWLVATFGARRVMRWSCWLCALFLVLVGFSPTTFLVMLSLFWMGVARTVFNLAANTGAIEVQQLYDRPILSTFHGIWSLACFVAGGISNRLIVWDVAPKAHFVTVAVLVSLAALAVAGNEKGRGEAPEKRPFFVMPDKYLFLLGLMSLCAMLCEGAMFDWSVNYFEKVVKAKKAFVTVGFLSFISAMAAGRLVGDRFIHRFGVYRMLVINGTLLAAGYVLAATFPHVATAAVGFLLTGAGTSILVPVIYMLASKSKKMAPGYALSSVTLIGYAGFLIGPLLVGNVSQQFGMQAAFYILSAASLLVVALALRVKKLASLSGL